MQHSKLRVVTSMMITCVVMVGWSGLGQAKSLPKKVRSMTGVIAERQDDRITLESEKGKRMMVQINQSTRICEEQTSSMAELGLDQIVEMQGKGRGNSFEAKRITLLAQDETLSMQKQAKSGPAYGEKAKTSQIKAKVVQLEPLTMVNWVQQQIVVVLAEKGKVIKQSVVSKEALQVGKKVQVNYHEVQTANQAVEITIPLVQSEKQAKN